MWQPRSIYIPKKKWRRWPLELLGTILKVVWIKPCDYGSIQVFISGPARLFANSNKGLKFVNETSTMLAMFVQLIVKHLNLVVYSVSFMFWVPQWMEPIEAFRTCMPLLALIYEDDWSLLWNQWFLFHLVCVVQVVLLFTDCRLGSLVWTFQRWPEEIWIKRPR